MSLRYSRWIGLVKSNDLDNVLLSREAEVVGDALAKKSYAKKIRTTPQSSCKWKLSKGSIRIIWVVEPTLD